MLCDRHPTSTSTSSSHRSKESEKSTTHKEKRWDTGKAREREEVDGEEDETTLSFAIFALTDLKEGEEVVLGEYLSYMFVFSLGSLF